MPTARTGKPPRATQPDIPVDMDKLRALVTAPVPPAAAPLNESGTLLPFTKKRRVTANVARQGAADEIFLPPPGSCPTCHGANYVRGDFPLGHEKFGQAVPCPDCKRVDTLRAKALDNLSNIPHDLVDMGASWATFPAAVDRAALAQMATIGRYIRAGLQGDERGALLMGANQIGKTGMAYCLYDALSQGKPLYGAAAHDTATPVGAVFTTAMSVFERARIAKFDKEKPWAYGDLVDHLVKIPLLVLDDLGAERLASNEFRMETLFDLLNRRVKSRTYTIITTNYNDKELRDELGDRLYARMTGRWFAKIGVRGHLGALAPS